MWRVLCLGWPGVAGLPCHCIDGCPPPNHIIKQGVIDTTPCFVFWNVAERPFRYTDGGPPPSQSR